MQQLISFLLIVILPLSLNAQNGIDLVKELNQLKDKEPDKIFVFSKTQDTLNRSFDTIHIAIIPNQWETYSIKVGYGFSPNGQTTFEISPAIIQPVKQRKISSDVNLKNISNEAVLFDEIPAKYISLEPITIIEKGDSIISVPTQKITAKRLIKKSSFELLTKEEAIKMNKREVLTIIDNVVIKQFLRPSNCRPQNTVEAIQKALNEKGYKCPVDNIISESTRKALIQFQKENNLPEGRLDIETLEELDIFKSQASFVDY